jgi:hypothetical protein
MVGDATERKAVLSLIERHFTKRDDVGERCFEGSLVHMADCITRYMLYCMIESAADGVCEFVDAKLKRSKERAVLYVDDLMMKYATWCHENNYEPSKFEKDFTSPNNSGGSGSHNHHASSLPHRYTHNMCTSRCLGGKQADPNT